MLNSYLFLKQNFECLFIHLFRLTGFALNTKRSAIAVISSNMPGTNHKRTILVY